MKRDTGFSLIELLVAMSVTLIVVAGTLTMLDQGRRTSEGISLTSNTLQNLRASMNYITRDLVQAGQGLPTGGISIPSGAGVPVNRPGPGNLTFGAAPNFFTAIPVVTTGGLLGPNIMRPSDIITVMYADNSLTLNQNVINDPVGPPICNGTIDPNGAFVNFDINCDPLGAAPGQQNIQAGDLLLFSNNQGNALETVTTIAGQTLNFATGDAYNLNQRTDPAGTLKQIQTPIGSGNYPPTTATRITMITYYLDNSQPGNPRLMRQINFNAPMAVAEGIEDLQYSYDFVDGATNPADQKDPPAGLSANQIQNVNVFVAGRSAAPYSQTGQFYRNNLSTKVSPRSLVFFNRYN
jgi:prepilin-type N-terminal cleavage/methylation domain-containing protein